MKIGIDYTAAVRQGAGIGRYTRHLVRALSQLDHENQYRLMVAGGWGPGDGLGSWPQNYRVRGVPVSDRWLSILWQRLRLPVPVQMVTGPLDLFHSPDFVLPPTGRARCLVTVHDLSFLRVPQHFVEGFSRYLTAAVRRAVNRADHILADSNCTRTDLMDLLGVEGDRITVVYPGVEDRFREITEPEPLARVREKYKLPKRFLLGLGTLQPRKNFDGLIGAFGQLITQSDKATVAEGLDLVIAGGRGWLAEGLAGHVNRLSLGDRVHLTGYVEDADLPALYNLAEVLVFPSWYEGFGLPIVEAMACGTPVVCADNSSLPEAAGQAAVMVDVQRPGNLAEALVCVTSDCERLAAMRVLGKAQARLFRWEVSAEAVLGLYRTFE